MQHESGVRPTTINGTVSALRFLYNVTLKRRDRKRQSFPVFRISAKIE